MQKREKRIKNNKSHQRQGQSVKENTHKTKQGIDDRKKDKEGK